MEFITVNENNLEKEHICCAISDKKGETCVSSKKEWLRERFKEGLVFLKLNERGKVFIEYIPAEYAWCPISANGYMHINCFWVSGQYKGRGYAAKLLEQCIEDARKQGKQGLTILSTVKKMPFVSDPNFLKYKGFLKADAAPPYYELLYLPFDASSPVPQFKPGILSGTTKEKGLVLYYSDQCPHAGKYAQIIQRIAQEKGRELILHKILTTDQAQNTPAPFTTYSFFYDGIFVTNEIFSEKKFEKFLEEHPV